MKTLLTTAALIAATTTSVQANSFSVNATVTNVQPNIVQVERPVYTEHCEKVRVPITETRTRNGGASGGNVLGGMILGGLAGKGVSGDDKGAAIGAVLGGMIAAENNRGTTYQVVTGHRYETQCSQIFDIEYVNQQDGSIVSYQWNGLTGNLHTYSGYSVGDDIIVSVTIN